MIVWFVELGLLHFVIMHLMNLFKTGYTNSSYHNVSLNQILLIKCKVKLSNALQTTNPLSDMVMSHACYGQLNWPYSSYSCCASDIAAVGTTFNVFSHDAAWAYTRTYNLPNDERLRTVVGNFKSLLSLQLYVLVSQRLQNKFLFLETCRFRI